MVDVRHPNLHPCPPLSLSRGGRTEGAPFPDAWFGNGASANGIASCAARRTGRHIFGPWARLSIRPGVHRPRTASAMGGPMRPNKADMLVELRRLLHDLFTARSE